MLLGRHIIAPAAEQRPLLRADDLSTFAASDVPCPLRDGRIRREVAASHGGAADRGQICPQSTEQPRVDRGEGSTPGALRSAVFSSVTQLNWIRWTRRSAGPASPCWTWCGRTKRVRIARSPWVQSWHCCCLHNCATAETGWSASPTFATQVLRQAYLGT